MYSLRVSLLPSQKLWVWAECVYCATSPVNLPFASSSFVIIVPLQQWRLQLTVNSINDLLNWTVKGTTIPLQAWTGPEGSRKSKLPDFRQSARKVVWLSALRTGRLHPPGNIPGTHACCGSGSSFGIAIELRAGRSGIDSRWGRVFPPVRPALGPTHPPVKWVPGLSRE